MRSRSIFLTAVVALVALGLTAAAGSAHRTAASHMRTTKMIVCPQASGEDVTCCGPPIDTLDTCCPGVGCPAARLTIVSSADPALSGSKIKLSGDLIDSSNVGQTITLWQKLPGANVFSQTQTTTTGTGGAYSFTLAAGTVQTNRAWYASAGSQQSLTVHEQVSALIKLGAKRSKSGEMSLSGTVAPAHAGQVVLLQRLAGAKWRTFSRPRLSRKSKFIAHLRKGARGLATVRAELPGDGRNIESFSRTLHTRPVP
jgi:hypothetical protein